MSVVVGEHVCGVCLEVAPSSTLHVLPCDHSFHTDCIVKWFRRGHDSCPMCRHVLESDEETSEDESSLSVASPLQPVTPRYLEMIPEPRLHRYLLPTLRLRRLRDCHSQLRRGIAAYYTRRRGLAAARKNLRELGAREGSFTELRRVERALHAVCARSKRSYLAAAAALMRRVQDVR